MAEATAAVLPYIASSVKQSGVQDCVHKCAIPAVTHTALSAVNVGVHAQIPMHS